MGILKIFKVLYVLNFSIVSIAFFITCPYKALWGLLFTNKVLFFQWVVVGMLGFNVTIVFACLFYSLIFDK